LNNAFRISRLNSHEFRRYNKKMKKWISLLTTFSFITIESIIFRTLSRFMKDNCFIKLTHHPTSREAHNSFVVSFTFALWAKLTVNGTEQERRQFLSYTLWHNCDVVIENWRSSVFYVVATSSVFGQLAVEWYALFFVIPLTGIGDINPLPLADIPFNLIVADKADRSYLVDHEKLTYHRNLIAICQQIYILNLCY